MGGGERRIVFLTYIPTLPNALTRLQLYIMGCDIHALIEQRDTKYDWDWANWINRGDPEIDRDYKMFSILANVRNSSSIPFISYMRGVNDDSCYAFKHWRDGDSDAHSTSWVTLEEMKEYSKKQNSDYLDELIKKLESFDAKPENIRIVFFFDN